MLAHRLRSAAPGWAAQLDLDAEPIEAIDELLELLLDDVVEDEREVRRARPPETGSPLMEPT